ncbi:MAG: OmpH family outer membrane protein [Saprospiraceae bacterium]|nr:OmpH family outer membrane protein [Saprospiraceae bacterium]
MGEFEQLGQQELTLTSEGLFNPIQNKINLAIKEVAAAEGYGYVIDAAQGAVLYADPAVNLLEKVKAILLKK